MKDQTPVRIRESVQWLVDDGLPRYCRSFDLDYGRQADKARESYKRMLAAAEVSGDGFWPHIRLVETRTVSFASVEALDAYLAEANDNVKESV